MKTTPVWVVFFPCVKKLKLNLKKEIKSRYWNLKTYGILVVFVLGLLMRDIPCNLSVPFVYSTMGLFILFSCNMFIKKIILIIFL